MGIAALEDKIVQRAVSEVMNAIYEKDFLGFSYGFRPGRGQHDAWMRSRWGSCEDGELGARPGHPRFFDTIDHGWMVKFIEHRIADRRLVRLMQKWLNAGVMEEGRARWCGDKGRRKGR